MDRLQRFKNVLTCLEDLKNNKMIIVPDRFDRENEADIIASGAITPEMMYWIATNAKGLICCPTTIEIAQQAGLAKMANFPILSDDTPFTISIDAVETSTGISAYDRAFTVNKLATGKATLKDFKIPGHMFPLIANKHLLKARDGHTEATVTLMKLAGLNETGVCCEIMNTDGRMLQGNQIQEFSQRFQLNSVSIEEIKDYYFFNQILVDVISQDEKRLIVRDSYSNIDYCVQIFNVFDDHFQDIVFDVLVINQHFDIVNNVLQANDVYIKLSRTARPTLVIDLKQMNLNTTWYVLNSILKILKIQKLNLVDLDDSLKNAFLKCDIDY